MLYNIPIWEKDFWSEMNMHLLYKMIQLSCDVDKVVVCLPSYNLAFL